MLRNRARKTFRFRYLLIAATIAVAVPSAAIDCNFYENSTATEFDDYGIVCAGTGAGCTECVEIIDVYG